MTALLYRNDAYLREAGAVVSSHSPEGGVQLDASLFFPTGGGQPGDSGYLRWEGGLVDIATTTRAPDGTITLVPGAATRLPPPGTRVTQLIDWDRRYRHMRMHTALHLLAAVIARPVTDGQIGAATSRLDFFMPQEPPDQAQIVVQLNLLIDSDLKVTETSISEEELAARPELLQTFSVRPAQGHGRLRVVGIGEGAGQIDLQPCSGTHVARIGEIGGLSIRDISRKGRNNHRITIALDN